MYNLYTYANFFLEIYILLFSISQLKFSQALEGTHEWIEV